MRTPFASLSVLVLLAGCPGPSEPTDTGTDAPSIDTSTTTDTPVTADAPVTTDTPATSDTGGDAGECLALSDECSESGTPCCAPGSCVPTGGAGLFVCRDETGCIPTGESCGTGDRCCGASACAGGSCVPTP